MLAHLRTGDLLETNAQEMLTSILCSGGRRVQSSRSNTKELSGGKIFRGDARLNRPETQDCESVKGDDAKKA